MRTGSLSMELEPFVNFQFDPESRMASLSVENAEIKKQKEMWGMGCPSVGCREGGS
jgi:hypothetical protein